MQKQKKFGLVFEEHLPEATPLYDAAISVGSLVSLKYKEFKEFFRVKQIKVDQGTVPRSAGQYQAFKDVLIQELKPEDFADIYAQTIAYDMFAARLHDDTPEDFSREEAARLIPKTNPFLRQIFNNLMKEVPGTSHNSFNNHSVVC